MKVRQLDLALMLCIPESVKPGVSKAPVFWKLIWRLGGPRLRSPPHLLNGKQNASPKRCPWTSPRSLLCDTLSYLTKGNWSGRLDAIKFETHWLWINWMGAVKYANQLAGIDPGLSPWSSGITLVFKNRKPFLLRSKGGMSMEKGLPPKN